MEDICPTCGRAYFSERRVSVVPFRERYLELIANGTKPTTIARRMGWVRKIKPDEPWITGDTSRLRRALGLSRETNAAVRGRYRQTVQAKTAEKLARALELDFHEVGV